MRLIVLHVIPGCRCTMRTTGFQDLTGFLKKILKTHFQMKQGKTCEIQ